MSRQRLRFAVRTGQEKGQGRAMRSAVSPSAAKEEVVRIPLLILPMGGQGTGTKGQE